MSEKDKPFTVSDRRHFTPDGQAKDQEPAEAPAGSAAEPATGTAAAPSEPPPSPPRPVSLGEFALSLGAQAGMLLSGQGEDAKDEPAALDAARQIISVLEMLQEKTAGNRTSEETRILEELLFQLRMAYVQRVGRR